MLDVGDRGLPHSIAVSRVGVHRGREITNVQSVAGGEHELSQRFTGAWAHDRRADRMALVISNQAGDAAGGVLG